MEVRFRWNFPRYRSEKDDSTSASRTPFIEGRGYLEDRLDGFERVTGLRLPTVYWRPTHSKLNACLSPETPSEYHLHPGDISDINGSVSLISSTFDFSKPSLKSF